MSSLQPDLFLGLATDGRGEFAPTPPWVILPALEHLLSIPRGDLLDAGAGLGALGMAVEAYAQANSRITNGPTGLRVTAVEREQDRCALLPAHWKVIQADFLAWAAEALADGASYDLIVCNPPFSAWLEWAQACLPLLRGTGHLLMIGPLAYLGGVERGGWLKTTHPKRVHAHCRRPRGQGWDDTREIAVVTWQQDWRGPCELVWV